LRCVIFTSVKSAGAAVDLYNKWAEGKPLTKDVIVRTHTSVDFNGEPAFIIVVFFDEQLHPAWVGKNDTQT